jgi:hypothetical protein
MSRWTMTTLLVTSTHAVAGPGPQLGSDHVGVGWTLHRGVLGRDEVRQRAFKPYLGGRETGRLRV